MARKTTGKKPATNPQSTVTNSSEGVGTDPIDYQNPAAQPDMPEQDASKAATTAPETPPEIITEPPESAASTGPVQSELISETPTDKSDTVAQDSVADAPPASLADPGPFSTTTSDELPPDSAEMPPSQTTTDMPPETTTDDPPSATTDTASSPNMAETDATDPPPAQTGAPIAVPPPPSAPPASGGFVPLVLGGVLAGALGYGVHFYLSQQATPETVDPAALAALQAEIETLRADLQTAVSGMDADAPDIAAIEAELADLRAALAEPGVTEADVATLIGGEIDALRAELADAGESVDLVPLLGQVQEVQAQVAELASEIAEVRELAETRLAEAETAVDEARARAGVEMIRSALELGAPYPEAIALLRDAGVSAPDALAGPAQTGVPTLENLQERFPAVARDALREALQDAPAESTTERLGNFLRAQVGARSTAPREGDDPDAILSRASAAVEAGDLGAALAELEALPDTAQPALQDWRADAQQRLNADTALPEFVAPYSTGQGSR